jgi:methylated-DNA-protein-cysteine methyltransferase-like protein
MPGFTSPPNPQLFRQQVWDVVRRIPAGKVATYGQVARIIPPPGGMHIKDYLAFGARWTGGAMSACPESVPWWRVLNSKGEISLRSGADEQRARLEAEGVAFDERGRVNLKYYGWDSGSS